MPYIQQGDRPDLDRIVDQFPVMKEGEINYVFTRVIHDYVLNNGLCYRVLNVACGILHCCLAEFIRVVVSPYEDKKRRENGYISALDMDFDDGERR